MTTYTMTGPDGKDYSIDGPPGATEDEVRAQMQAAHANLSAGGAQSGQPPDLPPGPKPLPNSPLGPPKNHWVEMMSRARTATPARHTGFSGQLSDALNNGAQRIAVPESNAQAAGEVGDYAIGNLQGIPGNIAGIPGDVQPFLKYAPFPLNLGAELPQMPTSEGIGNTLFGKPTSPEIAAGRETTGFWLPNAIGEGAKLAAPVISWADKIAGMAKSGLGQIFPMTAAIRDRNVAGEIRRTAEDPAALESAVRAGVTPNIPGSNPTTYQAFGDKGGGQGLANLDAAARATNKGDFAAREAAQQKAIRDKGNIEDAIPAGPAADHAAYVKQRLADLDAQRQRNEEDALDVAQRATRATGPEGMADVRGPQLRTAAEEASDAADKQASALYEAAIGDGATIVNARAVKGANDALDREAARAPETALDIGPAEAELRGLVRGYTPDMPLERIVRLDQQITKAMVKEKRLNGESASWGRLSILKSGVRRSIDAAIDERAAAAPSKFKTDVEDLTNADAFRENFGGGLASFGGLGRAVSEGSAGQTAVSGARGEGAIPSAAQAQGNQGGGFPNAPGDQGVLKATVKTRPTRRSLFTTIRDIGGIRVLDEKGDVLPETSVLLKVLGLTVKNGKISGSDVSKSILNNTRGRPADKVLEQLKGDGWFGRTSVAEERNLATGTKKGDDLQDLYDAIGDHQTARANGKGGLYHPESIPPNPRVDPQQYQEFLAGRAKDAGVEPKEGERSDTFAGRIRQAEMAQEKQRADAAAMAAPSQANIDPGTAARLREANAFYREKKQTFGEGPVGDILKTSGYGVYNVPGQGVPRNLFVRGENGAATIQAYRKAVGNDPVAMQTLEEHAAQSLRDSAMRGDGTLDPVKYATWRRQHASAMRELPPDLRGRFANAVAASNTLADVQAAGKAARTAFETDAVKKILKAGTDGEVTAQIKTIMGSPTSSQQVRNLAELSKQDQTGAAFQGLRGALRDHIYENFVANPNATAESFRKFLRQKNETLLHALTPDEVAQLHKMADAIDLTSREGVANKGAPGGGPLNLLRSLIYSGTRRAVSTGIATATGAATGASVGAHIGAVGGPLGAAAGATIAAVLEHVRQLGITKQADLLKEVMLNPDAMKALLERVPPGHNPSPTINRLVTALKSSGTRRRIATLGADVQQRDDNQQSSPPRSYADVIGAMRAAPAAN